MLSIIICSISPAQLQAVKQNIQETIGVEYEVIAIDNNEKKWPIAKAYNHGAQEAKYPYLLFMHEDVKFHSEDWAKFIGLKLGEPTCGIIGFAGSKVKLKSYSGWDQLYEWMHVFLYQGFEDKTKLDVRNVYLESPFEEVVVLDGLAMFVRKEVWKQKPFDEKHLTGFHCYDIDFSLQVAQDYKNYVCCSSKVLVEHSSQGSYNTLWFSETIRLHREKWNNLLPIKIEDIKISTRKMKILEEQSSYKFLERIIESDYPDKKTILKEFWKLPFSRVHFRHCLISTAKYFMYSASKKK